MKSLLGAQCQLTVRPRGASERFQLDGLHLTRLAIINSPVDVTNGAGDGWRELLAFAGERSVILTLSGISLGSAAELNLQACALSGELIDCHLVATSSRQLEGCFAVERMTYSGEQDEEVSFDLTLTSAGRVELV